MAVRTNATRHMTGRRAARVRCNGLVTEPCEEQVQSVCWRPFSAYLARSWAKWPGAQGATTAEAPRQSEMALIQGAELRQPFLSAPFATIGGGARRRQLDEATAAGGA